ncbi:MAG: glycogen synthase [Opitutales bacterium]|jgi:alpha-maltose-1-phosphate synthase|nr:glycogen synthase [Opitutales bacterium]MDP4879865.1 glycogen synthase [Opitutales bacterium]
MNSLIYTNEYPPYNYGGAGVHVEYLTRELAKLIDVDVRCFGDQNKPGTPLSVKGYPVSTDDFGAPKYLHTILASSQRAIDYNSDGNQADIVHCHTWYTHLAGIMTKLNYGIPLVLTGHSLEPLRPWKREQLAGGYDFSCWVERTAMEMADALIAVSEGTKTDILKHFNVPAEKIHVIYNGIDTDEYKVVDASPAHAKFGIPTDKPFVLFVGRITRQKGIVHLVEAIKYMHEGYNVVLCAGAPDTKEIAAEMTAAVDAAKKDREGIYWIDEMVNKTDIIQLYSGAAVFCCPSIYEPFGIINLEAMACETPVVGSMVGGIPEVVVHDETGFLVPVAQQSESPFSPLHPTSYAKDLAHNVNRLMEDPEKRERFAKAGRKRAVEKFSWTSIAEQTRDLYATLIKS